MRARLILLLALSSPLPGCYSCVTTIELEVRTATDLLEVAPAGTVLATRAGATYQDDDLLAEDISTDPARLGYLCEDSGIRYAFDRNDPDGNTWVEVDNFAVVSYASTYGSTVRGCVESTSLIFDVVEVVSGVSCLGSDADSSDVEFGVVHVEEVVEIVVDETDCSITVGGISTSADAPSAVVVLGDSDD